MLRVQDIMTTDVVTVSPSMSLRDAAELFARRHIGGAPVVDGQRVVGVVSTSDILNYAASAPAAHPPADETDDEWEPPPEEAVWDDGGASGSFFADRWAYAESDSVDFIAEAAGSGTAALDGHTVGEIMTGDILSLPPTADIALAAERMRTADVHRLLVMERGTLVGIVSTTDLARAVADRRVGRRTYVFGHPRA
jgi:CBS domain-containing protein